MLFGRRSEKIPPMDKVLRDANPPTGTVDGEPMPDDDEKRKKEFRRHSRKNSADKRVRNRQRRKQLPVLEYLVHVPDEAIPEGMTRDDFRVVGEGTTVDRIEYIPSRYLIHPSRGHYRPASSYGGRLTTGRPGVAHSDGPQAPPKVVWSL